MTMVMTVAPGAVLLDATGAQAAPGTHIHKIFAGEPEHPPTLFTAPSKG